MGRVRAHAAVRGKGVGPLVTGGRGWTPTVFPRVSVLVRQLSSPVIPLT